MSQIMGDLVLKICANLCNLWLKSRQKRENRKSDSL
jgi:hypothetical protein